MPRSSSNPFENLRAWVLWLTDEGKSSSCCQLATEDDLTLRPEKFDCRFCERLQQWSDLWPENKAAWDCHREMARRTVRDSQAGAWVIQSFTAGWSWQQIADLLARLDLILEIVVPTGPKEGHG